MIPGHLKQTSQKSGCAPHLILSVEPLEIKDDRHAVLANPLASDLQAALGVFLPIDDAAHSGTGLSRKRVARLVAGIVR